MKDYSYLQSHALEDGGSSGVGGVAGTAGTKRVTPRECAPGFPDDSYVPTSTYLLEAQPNIDYVKSCARFWFKARAESGGYYTNVAQDGTPSTSGPRHPMTQSRDAYGFVRAFMMSGEEEFLEHAEHALNYLYSIWLPEGGWIDAHDSFFEQYAVLGPATYCEATADPTHCGWWDKAEANLDEKMWDTDPAHTGYYFTGSPGWSSPSGKGFNATVDALTTHDYARWLADPERREQRVRDLGEQILTNFVGILGQYLGDFGFPDRFETNWTPVQGSATFTGHVLKTSWNLSRLYIALGDDRFRTGAEQTIEHVLTKVWDDSLDYRFKSRGTEPEWWELEQGFTSGLLAYYTGRDPELRARYLKLADESIAAFHRVYDDPVYGDAFKVPSGTRAKGDMYKAGYHTAETAYYGLLYGQLFYRHRPVSLHYRFRPTSEPRSIRLTPLYSPRLRMTDVTLDGAPYADFDPMTRRLDIPAEVGGIFKVTFWVDDTPAAGGQEATGQQACTLIDP